MKNGILLFVVFILGSGFVFDLPQDEWMQKRFDRMMNKRPYVHLPQLIAYEVDISKLSIAMYDIENPQKEIFAINKSGFYWDGEKVCNWEKINNTYGVSKDCDSSLPFGSRIQSYWIEKDQEWYEKYKAAFIELESFHDPNLRNTAPVRYSNETKVFLSYRGKKVFAIYKDLKASGWALVSANKVISKSKPRTDKLLSDNKFLENLKEIEACFSKKDAKCLSKYINPRKLKELGEVVREEMKCDTVIRMAKCLLDAKEVVLNEMNITLDRREFPCIFYHDHNTRSSGDTGIEVVVIGGNYELHLGMDEGTWKIESFNDIWNPEVKSRDFYFHCYRPKTKYEDFYENGILKKEIRHKGRIQAKKRKGLKLLPWEEKLLKDVSEKQKKGLLPYW